MLRKRNNFCVELLECRSEMQTRNPGSVLINHKGHEGARREPSGGFTPLRDFVSFVVDEFRTLPKSRIELRRVAGGNMSKKRWFECLRWVMLMGVMAWTASGVAQEAANRAEPPSPGAERDSVREVREQISEWEAAVAGT